MTRPHLHRVGRVLADLVYARAPIHQCEYRLRRLRHERPLPAALATVRPEHLLAVLDKYQDGELASQHVRAWAQLINGLRHANEGQAAPLTYQRPQADAISRAIEVLAGMEHSRSALTTGAVEELRQALGASAGRGGSRSPLRLERRLRDLVERWKIPDAGRVEHIMRFLYQSGYRRPLVMLTRAHLAAVLEAVAARPRREQRARSWARTVRLLYSKEEGRAGLIVPERGYAWSIGTVLQHLAAPPHERARRLDVAEIPSLLRMLDYPGPKHHYDQTEQDRERMMEMFQLTPAVDDEW